MKHLFVAIILLFASGMMTSVQAQDMIYTRAGEVVKAKIIEIKEYEVSYRDWDYPDGPIINIKTRDLKKIIFNNGRKMEFNVDPYEGGVQEIKNRDMQQCIKLDVFSPLTGNLTVGYERIIKIGLNAEGNVGIIGLGAHSERKANLKGAFIRLGPKLLFTSSNVGSRRLHGFAGGYIKPSIVLGTHAYIRENTYFYYDSLGLMVAGKARERFSRQFFVFDIIFGGQTLTAGRFTIDYYLGLGYGMVKTKVKPLTELPPGYEDDVFGEFNIDDDVFANLYSDVYLSKTIPLTFTMGLQLGYIFK